MDPVRVRPHAVEIYRRCESAIPSLTDLVLSGAATVHRESAPSNGEVLLDDDWLRSRIEDTSRRWGSPDPRVNATLWWYSAAPTLLGPGVAGLLTGGRAFALRPELLTLTVRRNGHVGYLARTRAEGVAGEGPEAFGREIAELAPVVERLGRLGGATARSLWSVTADALAGRLLTYARDLGDDDAATVPTLARAVAAASEVLPPPRYAALGVPPRPYVRRGSCCLIYLTPGAGGEPHGKCSSCPRQTPATREARVVAAHA